MSVTKMANPSKNVKTNKAGAQVLPASKRANKDELRNADLEKISGGDKAEGVGENSPYKSGLAMMPVARLIQDGPLLWANGGGAEDAGKLSGELSIPLRRRNLEGRFVLYLERHRARDKAFLGGGIVQAARDVLIRGRPPARSPRRRRRRCTLRPRYRRRRKGAGPELMTGGKARR
jgi:hypothetical protein